MIFTFRDLIKKTGISSLPYMPIDMPNVDTLLFLHTVAVTLWPSSPYIEGLILTKYKSKHIPCVSLINYLVGVAEDANECFSEATALRLQQELTSTSNVEKSNFVNENRFLSSNVSASFGDSPKQIKQLHANTTAEVSGYPHVKSTALHMQNGAPSNLSQFDTPSPTSTQVSKTCLVLHPVGLTRYNQFVL
jgi:hypothetical protein